MIFSPYFSNQLSFETFLTIVNTSNENNLDSFAIRGSWEKWDLKCCQGGNLSQGCSVPSEYCPHSPRLELKRPPICISNPQLDQMFCVYERNWYSNANVFEETAEGINQKMKSLCDYFLFKFCSYKKRVIMEIFFGDASFPLECFVLWYCGIGWPLHPPSLCHIRLPECLVSNLNILIFLLHFTLYS